MKSELKAKFLRYILNKKKEDEGFTLIELLVVIIIIGILSAIALPSFLNQANKAKQTEAKTYVGSMNRAQQTYYLENGKFASNVEFDSLGLGIAKETTNYKYVIAPATGATTTVTNQAQPQPQANGIKAYIGGVKVGNVTATNEGTTVAVLCEARLGKNATGGTVATGTEDVIFNTPSLTCPPTYINLSNNTPTSSQPGQTSSPATTSGG